MLEFILFQFYMSQDGNVKIKEMRSLNFLCDTIHNSKKRDTNFAVVAVVVYQ
jgi:hypothetical protein